MNPIIFSKFKQRWHRLQQHWPLKPRTRAELQQLLVVAESRHIVEHESRQMLEGVLRISDMVARDIMVAAPRIDKLNISLSVEDLVHRVIDIGHSRYPVFEDDTDNVIGILLAKDLLKLQRAPDFNIRALLRPVLYIPESKGLVDLLREFKRNRSHLALVVDEFGVTSGLITLEDILEEIVGEIEDEFDTRETDNGDIYTLADTSYRVAGNTPLEKVNQAFATCLSTDNNEQFDTIAGYISHHIGHVPNRGESCEIGGLRFEVMHRSGGTVRWFRVHVLPKRPDEEVS